MRVSSCKIRPFVYKSDIVSLAQSDYKLGTVPRAYESFRPKKSQIFQMWEENCQNKLNNLRNPNFFTNLL
jgi:hypothetical protein